MRLSNTDAMVVRTVLRHNGVPDSMHDSVINEFIFTEWVNHRQRINPQAIKTYRRIYGSLTHEERQRAA